MGRRGLVGLFVMYISLTAPRVGGSNPRRSSLNFRIFIQKIPLLWPTTHADKEPLEPLEPLGSIRLTLDVRVR